MANFEGYNSARNYGDRQAIKNVGPPGGQDRRMQKMVEYFGGVPKDLSIDHIYSHGSTYGTIQDALAKRFATVFKDKLYGTIKYKNWSPWIFLYPWHYVKPNEGIDIIYNEIVMADGIAPRLAELGTPRIFEERLSERGDRMLRRGVGLYLESTFFMTPEGEARYQRQLAQLAAITLKTCEFDIALEVLNAWANQPKRAYMMNGMYTEDGQDSYLDFLKSEVETWAIVNKTPESEGFINLVTRLETLMHVYRDGANPDTLVLPPNMKRFYSLHKDFRRWNDAGPDSVKNRKEKLVPNESGVPLSTFQGFDIVDFQIYRSTTASRFEAGDLFTVNEQIGSYTLMNIEEALPDESLFDSYKTRYRNILWYNEDKDDFVEIKYSQAIKNAVVSLEEFIDKFSEGNDSVTVKQLYTDEAGNLSKDADLHVKRMVASGVEGATLDTPYTASEIIALIDDDKYFPLNVVLFRPFQTYSVSTAILMKRGADTGEMYIGHTDFQVSTSAAVKDLIGHWTFFEKAFTKNPRNIMAVENAMCQRYRFGASTTFFTPGDYDTISRQGGITKKEDMKGSVMPVITLVEDMEDTNIVDIIASRNDRLRNNKITGLQFVDEKLGIDEVNVKELSEHRKDFETYQLIPNTVCFRDCYQYGQGFKSIKTNCGHWGKYIYPGVGKTRDAMNYASIEKLMGSNMMNAA